MTRKQRRLTLIGAAGLTLAVAVALILFALQDQVVFFKSPSDLAAAATSGERVRVGGLVEAGSVTKTGTEVSFAVTDTNATIKVRYDGIVPDLFREGQGVVTEGVVGADGWLVADTVLAKHDENYMPKEVVDSLKAQGVWKDGEGIVGDREAVAGETDGRAETN